MQGRIIFLLEERSMKDLLMGLLPRLFPGLKHEEHFLCVTHQGKSDLDISIPRKLQAWQIAGDRFVILRDNDNANCIDIKARFVQTCQRYGRPDTLVRLVCQELESWYIGDLQALAAAFDDPKLDSPALRKKFIDPDSWQKPSDQLKRLIPFFQKGSAAQAMAHTLRYEGNRSKSFLAFVTGVTRLTEEMGYRPVDSGLTQKTDG